ncbi:Ku domain-containing protein Pku80 [Schizosaccharomyces japonicus yFS275]|uniref:ATP-dependent DNA helicase II subunit 2 n=1 Tax=Schizosaccharomyces japonicus (strain yFS275 / FY16936) TaxID=402676 RepID=B6K6N5_SCHJY|nr:Ku domain-containing protein Pku80 [Schizosaccharomyces japonicus yFS275]EEB09189.1 Ku domain-containing protein Pku80 [Schizosaccharomyces japonicus yFS275]
MADKKCTVYLLDLGNDMGKRYYGRNETDLEYQMTFVWNSLSQRLLENKKTDVIGIVGFKTDESRNDLVEQEAYWNIAVFYPIQTAKFAQLQDLRPRLSASKTMQGDLLSAIVVSFDLIGRYCKANKWTKELFIGTGARGTIDFEDSDGIAEQIAQHDVHITLGLTRDLKLERHTYDNQLLQFLEKCNGKLLTAQNLMEEAQRPPIRKVKPVPIFRGILSLGNPQDPDASLAFPIERYPYTRIAKPPVSTAFDASAKPSADPSGADNDEVMSQPNLGMHSDVVSTIRTYVVHDPVKDETFEVDRKDLESGYSYGRTIIPISSTDEDIMSLDTQAGLEVLGFAPKSCFPPFYFMSETNLIVNKKDDEQTATQLTSFVEAMIQEDRYALARFVNKNHNGPILLVLIPHIENGTHCLIDVQLPYAEDVRAFSFPSLEHVTTGEEKMRVQNAVDAYVSSMLLDNPAIQQSSKAPVFEPQFSYSVMRHRIQQAIQHYAFHPNAPLPEPSPYLVHYTHAPEAALRNAQDALNTLQGVLEPIVHEAPKVEPAEKESQVSVLSISDAEIEAMLNSTAEEQLETEKEPVLHVSASDPVYTFYELIKNPFGLDDAITEMESAIRLLLTEGKLDSAKESLIALRETCIREDESEQYNGFIVELQNELISGKYQNAMNFEQLILQQHLGSISFDELPMS